MKTSKNISKTSKSRKLNFYFMVLDSIINKNRFKWLITKEFSKQRLNHYIKSFKKQGFLVKKGYGIWELTSQGNEFYKVLKQEYIRSKSSSLGTGSNSLINLHALNISIPISEGSVSFVKDFEGYVQSSFNNWIPEYKKFINPIGFTLKNNNNKSVTIQLFSRNIINLNEVFNLVNKSIYFVGGLLKDKGVLLDVFNARVNTFHVFINNDDLGKVLNKGMTVEVALGRCKEKILPNDVDKDAVAWTDSSPFRGIESNDIAYIRNYVLMPEKVDKLFSITAGFVENMDIYNKNIKLHLDVMREMKDTLREIKDSLKK